MCWILLVSVIYCCETNFPQLWNGKQHSITISGVWMLWSGMRTWAQWEGLSLLDDVCILSWRVQHFLWPPHGAGPSCRVVMGSKRECPSGCQESQAQWCGFFWPSLGSLGTLLPCSAGQSTQTQAEGHKSHLFLGGMSENSGASFYDVMVKWQKLTPHSRTHVHCGLSHWFAGRRDIKWT